ncbi:hypothetical protein DER46DRAFT_584981 [Fusarium sp. MPI-SDFR-AT-0072]|nr:hypothetical protein DER46DRAFT_584981 [Fusarium sp. MPI-SDFR-AT-0072]
MVRDSDSSGFSLHFFFFFFFFFFCSLARSFCGFCSSPFLYAGFLYSVVSEAQVIAVVNLWEPCGDLATSNAERDRVRG